MRALRFTQGPRGAPLIPRDVERHLVLGGGRSVLALVVLALFLFVPRRVIANVFHFSLRQCVPNCAASVEFASAVVDDCPCETTFITSSK